VIVEDVHPEWEKAMSAPSDYSDYVVATQGDQLWYATKLFPQGLQPIAKFEAFKGKTVIVFKTVHHLVGSTKDTYKARRKPQIQAMMRPISRNLYA
jgi:hypothetical protein